MNARKRIATAHDVQAAEDGKRQQNQICHVVKLRVMNPRQITTTVFPEAMDFVIGWSLLCHPLRAARCHLHLGCQMKGRERQEAGRYHKQQQADCAMHVGNVEAALTRAAYQVQSFQHAIRLKERHLEQQMFVAHVKDIEVKETQADMEQMKLGHINEMKGRMQRKYDAKVVHTNVIQKSSSLLKTTQKK
jgi:hypothetical protein